MFSKSMGLAVMAFAAFSSLPISAQEPGIEYGQASELRGVTRIFVDAGSDIQQRDLIAKEVRKRLPDLIVVSRPEEADIHLRYSLKETVAGKTDWAGTVVKVVGSNRVRVLFSYRDETPPIFGRETFMSSGMELAKPYIFVMQFAKIYRKANGGGKL